jgi:hypothetical protein
MTVELTMALVSVSQGVVVGATGEEPVPEAPGITVEWTISLVSVSQGVVVAGTEA